jgi:hypothetical protein
MIKLVELIIVVTLLIFSFLAGVKYADSVKSHVSWLFENKEDEIELPDLSNENAVEITAPAEGSAPLEGEAPVPVDQQKSLENQGSSNAVDANAPANPDPAQDSPNSPGNPPAYNQPKVDVKPKK